MPRTKVNLITILPEKTDSSKSMEWDGKIFGMN